MSHDLTSPLSPERRQAAIAFAFDEIWNDPQWADIPKPKMIDGVMRFPRPSRDSVQEAAEAAVRDVEAYREELGRILRGESPKDAMEATCWGRPGTAYREEHIAYLKTRAAEYT